MKGDIPTELLSTEGDKSTEGDISTEGDKSTEEDKSTEGDKSTERNIPTEEDIPMQENILTKKSTEKDKSSKGDIFTERDISTKTRTSSKGTLIRLPRQTPTTADGIPIFDRNKVSLDFPGSLFGPSVSLLIKTTKIVGNVIQNSAVRYQTFLRLFRPLFRGPFEIKGLDPPTTTTKAPKTADNEVRKR